jgi:hypothetical protein
MDDCKHIERKIAYLLIVSLLEEVKFQGESDGALRHFETLLEDLLREQFLD